MYSNYSMYMIRIRTNNDTFSVCVVDNKHMSSYPAVKRSIYFDSNNVLYKSESTHTAGE